MNDPGPSWMQIETSLEEELTLENATRSISAELDPDKIKELCLSLFRANFHHRKLLLQAVTHIADLENDDWKR